MNVNYFSRGERPSLETDGLALGASSTLAFRASDFEPVLAFIKVGGGGSSNADNVGYVSFINSDAFPDTDVVEAAKTIVAEAQEFWIVGRSDEGFSEVTSNPDNLELSAEINSAFQLLELFDFLHPSGELVSIE